MNVLQVTPQYLPNIGGVEIIVQKISETLAADGVRVTVYSADLINSMVRQQEINGVLVRRFISLLADPFYITEPKLVAALRREKAEIVHVHSIHTFLPFLVALFKRRKQSLLLQPHYHRFGQSPLRNSVFKLYKYALNNVVFSRAALIIANSTYEKKILCQDFPRCRNVLLVPEGIDVDEIRDVKHDPVEPKRILYVGALRRYKNVDKVIKGFACLIGKGYTHFRLVIVGEGSEYKSLTNLAYDSGVDSSIEWKHGLSRQQLLNEFAKASVFIMLSPLESFSRVVYEALLMRIPAVVLNFGATAHLVKAGLAEGVNSLNPEEIAGALLKATRKTYPKVTEGTNTFLNWKEYSSKIIGIYNRLLER